MRISLVNTIIEFKINHIKLFILIGLLIQLNNLNAQEIHFSQFYSTPIITNPANTGTSDNDFRIANNYRNQWASIGVPFNTLYVSLDKKLSISNQMFGIGGFVIHDQSSVYNLSANEFLFSLSYSKFINNQQFVVGLQPGFVFKSYNSNGLTFGTQFDQVAQIFNTNLPSLENNLTGSTQYFDMNVGALWRAFIKNIMPTVGFSVSHIIRPIETFSTASNGTRLPMKLTFNSQVYIPITSKVDLTPSMLYGNTPGANELLLGAIEGYSFNNFSIPVKKVYAVNMFRLNPMRDIDAFILGGGVKFDKFDIGITYDINISPLNNVSNFNGAFEISLIYTGNGHPKLVSEPCIIY